MRRINTSQYTALVASVNPILGAAHPSYDGTVAFDGTTYRTSFCGYLVCSSPFIHIDGGLLMCSDLSITDRDAGVFVASHLPISVLRSEKKRLKTDLEELDGLLTEMGSLMKNREMGIIFGHESGASQHKYIYDILIGLGYRPRWAYQSISEQQVFNLDHINNRKTTTLNGNEIPIPEEINEDALVNAPLLTRMLLSLLYR